MYSKEIKNEVVNLDQEILLYKEIHEVTTEDGVKLLITRKIPVKSKPKPFPLLFIHGLGQNRYSWDLSKRSMQNYFVENIYETYNLELRGHGLSRERGSGYPNNFDDYFRYDIPATLRYIKRVSKAKKIFLCGHSLGGTIAYCLGPKHERSIAGIISIGGPFNFGRSQYLLKIIGKIIEFLHTYPPISNIKFPYFPVDAIGTLLIHTLFFFDNPLNFFPYQLWYPKSIEKDILLERIEKGFDRTGYNVFRTMAHWAASDKFESISGKLDYTCGIQNMYVPILFIGGSSDSAIPKENIEPGYEKSKSEDKILKIFGPENHKVEWGHLDLICGREAPFEVWPYILKWMNERL